MEKNPHDEMATLAGELEATERILSGRHNAIINGLARGMGKTEADPPKVYGFFNKDFQSDVRNVLLRHRDFLLVKIAQVAGKVTNDA